MVIKMGELLSSGNRWNQVRYRAYAPVYDWLARPLERGRRRAIDRLELESGDHVLIPGCGTGMDLRYLPEGVKVTALDITPTMVKRTRRRADKLDVDVDVQVGDAQNLVFQDGCFDAVLLHLVLSVVPEPGRVAEETERVLGSGGCVSVYDKFIREGEKPGFIRRAVNPVARFLFTDLNRRLEPVFSGTQFDFGEGDKFLGGLYTATHATKG